MLEQILSAVFLEGSFISFCLLVPMAVVMLVVSVVYIVFDLISYFTRR